ncbi:cobyrinate a,c-diamide synthase [Nitrospira moscoviensis]|uniref:Cobyrinate a,c-diamide synthase n=1 Tax=Nitrospira moscoviensis TaxID=42253 RepID=A0A0K2GBA6_NITMO|nr:cobyrinate a,c-diamide synthase [Nitrospira moscoviensis]ALA58251.1 Cobyrinic acid A,C-diamide synthase [Nitrospira moscoviensis]
MTFPRLIIAGTQSGVGKTTVTLAILAALRQRGRRVQPFKVGPDFIDSGHHTAVTGRPSRNLDGWMLGESVNREIFVRAAAEADISIIEGMMGLFDGSSPVSDTGSTAELAKQLAAPVLLVIDGSAMARSAAAMASGYAKFDPDVHVAGVLFNRVAGEGHYRLLKEAVEAETDLAVVGYLKPDPAVTVPDRHLGLVTAIEEGSTELYDRLAKAAAETIDVDRVEALAHGAGHLASLPSPPHLRGRGWVGGSVRIGVAYDPAFGFYYQDNLDLLKAEGAEIVNFSPLRDRALPDVAMLYLGGGYPELHGPALSENVGMRQAIRAFAERGGVIYAECGGMMYLTQAIRDFEGRAHDMVGLFPAEAVMKKADLTLGYRTVELSRDCLLGAAGMMARGHEFHYSTLIPRGSLQYACAISDARGSSRGQDGLVTGRVLALYTHVHFASRPQLAAALVDAASRATSRVSASQTGV